jgi:hypothetical protein
MELPKGKSDATNCKWFVAEQVVDAPVVRA